MSYLQNTIYHIYNRTNNKETLFKDDDDYLRFLEGVRKHILPTAEILGWCLMPNHFHFLVYTTEQSVQQTKVGGLSLQEIQKGIKNLLSSYTKYINFRYKRSGNLFQQKTKYKVIDKDSFQVLHYIHQNPWKAKFVDKLELWKYSSFVDFIGLRKGTLCNRQLAIELLGMQMKVFYEESYSSVSNDTIMKLALDDV